MALFGELAATQGEVVDAASNHAAVAVGLERAARRVFGLAPAAKHNLSLRDAAASNR